MIGNFIYFAGEYLLKWGFLALNGVYILFLIIIFQQAKAMDRVITASKVSNLIIYVALANILIGILIFVTALVIL
jgi:hypothetical protein